VIHVVVPALDEAHNLPRMLAGLRDRLDPLGVPWRLVLVDDGSRDGTGEVARAASRPEAPVEVVTHPRNLGPGAAFRSGFLRVLADAGPQDVVLTLEGDSTSDPAVLPRLLQRVWEEGDDVALASCYLFGGGIVGTSLHRVGLSHLANGLMKKTLGLSGLATLSSFYRAYHVRALRALHARWGDGFIASRGFECMVELLHRAARLGLRVSEVPMRLDGSRRLGRSKMRVSTTSLAYLRLMLDVRLGRI
jgi:dolichol-phosphate mannosyltransferase